MNELQIFAFGDNLVRTVQKDGEPWWIARDVCAVLGLGNPRTSLALLEEDEKDVHIMDTPGGPQEMTTISESGLYNLIFRSRKAEAKAFRRWVTHEVLPAIRRTGMYDANGQKLTALLDRYGDTMTAEARSQLVLTIAGVPSATPTITSYCYTSPLTPEVMNGLRRFLDEVYPSRPVEVPTQSMWKKYSQWCSENNVTALLSKNSFAHALGKLGCKRIMIYSGGKKHNGWRLENEEVAG